MAWANVTGLLLQRPGFDPRSVHMERVLGKVARGQVSLQLLWFPPLNIIPLMLQNPHSSYHQQYTISVTESVIT
jgi:hypothetical protein